MKNLNIEIGIWRIEDTVIQCVKQDNVNRYIDGNNVNESQRISKTTYWSLPVHFALKDWTSLTEMQDLMEIMVIMRCILNLPQNDEVDKNTWIIVKAIIASKETDLAA